MATEPLRRKKPTQTHPHHYNYYNKKSQESRYSISVPFSIVRYCTRIANKSGLKAVFTLSASKSSVAATVTTGRGDDHTHKRPIHSVWYGHANSIDNNMTPNECLVSSKGLCDKQDSGIEQWSEKAAVVTTITPLTPCDSRGSGRDTGSRRRRRKESPSTDVQEDEDSGWRESADGEEASEEKYP